MRRAQGLILAVALGLAGAGCAQLKSNKTVCPEYRDMLCASAPECSMDYQRGCHVCQCRPAAAIGAGSTLPSGLSPDHR